MDSTHTGCSGYAYQLAELGPNPFGALPFGETKPFPEPGVVDKLTRPLVTVRVHHRSGEYEPLHYGLRENVILQIDH